MERILKTVREIVRQNFPTNNEGNPSVYGDAQTIGGWFHGDREVISNNLLPAIAFDGEDRSSEWALFHGEEHIWQFSILCYVRLDHTDETVELLYRMTDIVDRIMRKHSRVWIFEKCIYDLEDFINPSHLQIHTGLDPFAEEIQADWEARWNVTHQVQGATDAIPTIPALNDADKYAAAYWKMFEGGSVAGATFSYETRAGSTYYATPADVLSSYQGKFIRPVRLLNLVRRKQISYGVVPKMGQQFLRASQLQYEAHEIDTIHEFGPNNLP